jgi:hypothetical protein
MKKVPNGYMEGISIRVSSFGLAGDKAPDVNSDGSSAIANTFDVIVVYHCHWVRAVQQTRHAKKVTDQVSHHGGMKKSCG